MRAQAGRWAPRATPPFEPMKLKRSTLQRRVNLRRGGTKAQRNKYGVAMDALSRKTRTHNGVEYHSKLEARYAAMLDLRLKEIGPFRIKSWARQVPIKLEVNGKLICTYIVDFVVEHPDGHLEWIEVKGFDTDVWKLKQKLFHALFPDRKLTVVRTT